MLSRTPIKHWLAPISTRLWQESTSREPGCASEPRSGRVSAAHPGRRRRSNYWIPTAGKAPYLLFRFYGPEEAFFNTTLVLDDAELMRQGQIIDLNMDPSGDSPGYGASGQTGRSGDDD